jgi:hypothetical protein
MEQTFHELSTEDRDRLSNQRLVIEQRLEGDPDELARYATAAGKLAILNELLVAGVFAPAQTYELQSMGIVLGDVFVQACGWEWRMVEDEYGRDPCITVPGTTVALFPMTMISKRVEHGGTVDVFALFDEISADIATLSPIAN